jgi:hypothetical protein
MICVTLTWIAVVRVKWYSVYNTVFVYQSAIDMKENSPDIVLEKSCWGLVSWAGVPWVVIASADVSFCQLLGQLVAGWARMALAGSFFCPPSFLTFQLVSNRVSRQDETHTRLLSLGLYTIGRIWKVPQKPMCWMISTQFGAVGRRQNL